MVYNATYQLLISAAELSFSLLSKTVPFMIIGVVFAEFIIVLKVTDKVAYLARPISNFANLRDECGASFMTAFISPTSANSMLAAFYNDKLIEKKELFIASIMTSFPAILMHWRALLPVLIPLLGMTGIIYFCILVLIGLIKTLFIMLVGRVFLEKSDYEPINHPVEIRPGIKEAFKISLQSSKSILKRILSMTIPVFFIVCIMITAGVFDVLSDHLAFICEYFPIPPAGLSIIMAQFANYMAAHSAASTLLSTGVLTSKQIILTLLVGDILSSITVSMKFLVPYYVGIFGPKIGMQILAIATTLRIGIMLLVIFALALFW
ncbi:MAG: nucleoside recognition domain-containing protein [Methanosarcinaceae archaeon]